MATRRAKRKGGPGRKSRAPRPSSPLPNGSYAWRGKAIPFGKLPKSEQARHRARWAADAARTRARAKVAAEAIKEGRAAREWVKRRTAWVPKHGHENQYAAMVPPEEIKFSPRTILEIRKIQKASHAAYKKQKHGGGKALEIAEKILELLGPDVERMPQLWWYH